MVYMSIPKPDLRFFFFRRIYLVVHSTYVHVHKCLEKECRIINQSESCTFRPPRLLPCCFPLLRRQISSDITSSPLLSTATKALTSKELAWRLNKSACNSAYFSMGSTAGVKYDLILALRSQVFEYIYIYIFYRHAFEYLQPACSEKKREKNAVFLRKSLTIVDLFEGLWSAGT